MMSAGISAATFYGYHREVVKALIILVAVLLQSGVWARRMPLRVCRTGVG